MINLIRISIAALLMSGSAAWADLEENKEIALNAVKEVFGAGNLDAIDTYFAEDYIQHNPMVPSGSNAIRMLISSLRGSDAPDAPSSEFYRVLAEDDMVVTHLVSYSFGAPVVIFDVYRIEDGKLAEHWDNIAPLRDEPNPSGRTQVDGETEIRDLDKTAENKALVTELIQGLFIDQEELNITDYISPVQYIQHNPDAGDGLEGLGALIQASIERGMPVRYDSIEIVVAEGNFVFVASAGARGDVPTAFFDLFRVEDGLIVEHWDVIAPIQTENVAPGYPGKF